VSSAKILPYLVEGNDIDLSFDNPFAQFGLTARNKDITIRLNKGKGGVWIYLYGDPPRNVVIEDNLLLQTKGLLVAVQTSSMG
jgi:hypothetical protein